jgi:quinolinate synthase
MSVGTSQGLLLEPIQRLKGERGAVILAHNYQLGEVQDIADFVGDSLELSRQAAAAQAEVIVFCGVRFMAETAKLLSPERIVLLPDAKAGCPLCDMAAVEKVRAWKAEHPGRPTVAYVNTTAAVKAESDICCTSANSVKVVESLDAEDILFLPDRNLGLWTQGQTGKRLLLWDGFCPTHLKMTAPDVRRARREHPEAEIIVHPECSPEVTVLADLVASTGGMVRRARETSARQLVLGTEVGILHRLRADHPDKEFFPLNRRAVCPNMKKITLEKVLWSLEELEPRIEVPADVQAKARLTIERMLAL